MEKWKDGFLKCNGLNIHYYRTGGDKPQVVFNHGAMDDGLCWTRVVKVLEKDYDVIMIDARGHGRSENGSGDYSSTSRAKDTIEAMEQLGLDKPVIGGHSMGADVSMKVAATKPNMVRGVFLEDPPVVMPGQPIFGGDLMEGKDVAKMMVRIFGFYKYAPKFISKPLAKKMMPVSPDDEIIPWLNSKQRMSRDFLKSMNSMVDFEDGSAFKTLKKIKVPILVFMGDRDTGSIVGEEAAKEMKKVVPGIQIVHLKGANHDIRRAKFEGYMKALQKFLKSQYK